MGVVRKPPYPLKQRWTPSSGATEEVPVIGFKAAYAATATLTCAPEARAVGWPQRSAHGLIDSQPVHAPAGCILP